MATEQRCPWCGTDPLYVAYHDDEWGRPERDPRALWEALILESFQAGLSWITILRRREGFRAAFQGFQPALIATWGAAEIATLVADSRIIRHRGKIEATIAGARAYLAIEGRDGFSAFLWAHVGSRPLQNARIPGSVPAETAESLVLAKALKRAGFKFCGPTICYAFMQAVGMVNDHLTTCPAHAQVQSMDRALG